MSGLFYSLGRHAAPALLKGKWMMHSLIGGKDDEIESEYLLGCLLAEMYERKTGLCRDADVESLLSETGARLTGCMKNKTRRFSFKCDNAPQPNALALPGGFIYISLPLLELCGWNRDETAFILAHEMGHIVRAHASKRFITSLAANAVSKTAIHGGYAKRVVLDMLVKVMGRGYSQAQEFDADRFALRLLRAAHIDAGAGERALARMGTLNGTEDSGLGRYLSTHPPITERIARIRTRCAAQNYGDA